MGLRQTRVNRAPLTARRCQGQLDRVDHILGAHVCAKLPSDDVAAVIIQNSADIIPAPPEDLELGKVGLPHLVDGRGLDRERVGSLDHHIVWCRDQIRSF